MQTHEDCNVGRFVTQFISDHGASREKLVDSDCIRTGSAPAEISYSLVNRLCYSYILQAVLQGDHEE